MTIRLADPAHDAAACAAIYAPSVEATPISFELVPPDAAEFRARMEKYSRTHPYLVAELDGGDGPAIAGYTYACDWASRAAYAWTVETSVYVDGAHHGKGIGRALYTELFKRLRAQGFRVAVAGVTLPNPASIGLHESLGFEPIGKLRNVGFKLAAWHDVGYWELALQPLGDGAPAPPLPPRPTA